MKLCETFCSCFTIPQAIKILSLTTIMIWIMSLVDVIMEGSGVIIILTAVGAVTSFVINIFTCVTASDNYNILVRYEH